jgi:DNA mismatch repair protein MutL
MHVFYNTPVRRKFLRTTATEMGHICEVFTRVALAQPSMHLTLRHNGKDVYEVPVTAGLLDRLGLFFGAELRDKLYPVEAARGPVRLSGFVADPSCERGNPKMQYLFINGRCIRDRSLSHALQEAYRGLLMTGRYAVAALFLDLPPDQVDVNVHPTKVEVRFRDASALYNLVLNTVRERLRAADLTPQLRVTSPLALRPLLVPPVAAAALHASPSGQSPQSEGRLPQAHNHASAVQVQSASADIGAAGQFSVDEGRAASKAIQLYDAYLVLETPEGMLVIDQHALHERILFEEFKIRFETGQLEKQRLLIPQPVDLPAEQAVRVLEYRDALGKLGLDVEDFGGSTVLLTSYPAILGNRSAESILQIVVDHLVSKERPPSRDALLNDLMSLMACHAAVRAGDHLSSEAIAELVARRDLATDAHHCPHGRPTSLLLSRQELDRQFRRT